MLNRLWKNSKIKISNSNESENKFLRNKMFDFNTSNIPLKQKEPYIFINCVAKTPDNQIVGGVKTYMYYWNILFIDLLWVDEQYRGRGLGSMILDHAEKDAKKRGCTLSHVDTFDFQAKDFYIKQGYEIFGVLDDCPKGHTRYYLKKSL